MLFAGEKAPQKVVGLANSKLATYGTDPVIVAAVKAENDKNKTLAQIQDMDKKWMGHAGIADYMRALMESQCGAYLKIIFWPKIFILRQLLPKTEAGSERYLRRCLLLCCRGLFLWPFSEICSEGAKPSEVPYFYFRHSHGGTGLGSRHKPFWAARA
jgi:hypothetical protein